MINGEKRTYNLYLPSDYNKKTPYPVVFLFHGNPSNGWQMNLYTKMNKTAEKHGFILVYPNALNKRWNFDDADINFIKTLIETLQKQYAINPQKQYFVGMSAGGMFCHLLAQNIPNQMAAIAVVAGNMLNPKFLKNPIKPNIPIVMFHGTGDFTYNGIKNDKGEMAVLSTENTLNYYVDGNISKPITTPLTNKKGKTTVLKMDYRPSKPILFYKILNGGHHWPNARFNANLFTFSKLGKFNCDIKTNELIWEFLSNYSK